jgi:hypothetical protein
MPQPTTNNLEGWEEKWQELIKPKPIRGFSSGNIQAVNWSNVKIDDVKQFISSSPTSVNTIWRS